MNLVDFERRTESKGQSTKEPDPNERVLTLIRPAAFELP